jgi:hypothetical protein
MKLFWEQEEVEVTTEDQTPIDLLEKLGPKGRAMLLEVLVLNYWMETEQMIRDCIRGVPES